MIYQFTADGIPKGQPRARATIRGKHAGVYDPGTADGWKAIVAAAGRQERPAQPIAGPVSVGLVFTFPRPKRLLRSRDPDGEMPHTAKPDADNLAKAVLDALTQDGWWGDDAQVTDLMVRKLYVCRGGRPGVAVSVVVRESAQ